MFPSLFSKLHEVVSILWHRKNKAGKQTNKTVNQINQLTNQPTKKGTNKTYSLWADGQHSWCAAATRSLWNLRAPRVSSCKLKAFYWRWSWLYLTPCCLDRFGFNWAYCHGTTFSFIKQYAYWFVWSLVLHEREQQQQNFLWLLRLAANSTLVTAEAQVLWKGIGDVATLPVSCHVLPTSSKNSLTPFRLCLSSFLL